MATGSAGSQPANQLLENIKVAVRLRPFTEKEKQRNNKRIVDIEQNTVVLYTPKHKDVHLKRFTFDYSYWSHDGFRKEPSSGLNIPDTSQPNHQKYVGQAKVFEDLGQFLLYNALEGYNSALLAYGQTGSGKSYTVSGYGQNEGILPRFGRALFEELDKKMLEANKTTSNIISESKENSTSEGEGKQAAYRYEVYFSMIEIYNEVVRDLLSKSHGDFLAQSSSRKGLKVREHPKHGFFVENLSSFLCADREEIEQRIEEGQLNKSIAATSMNETSSRGHTIYEFKIKQFKSRLPSEQEETAGETVTISVVQLVDLAGSERMAVHLNNLPQTSQTTSLLATQPIGKTSSSARSRSPGFRTSGSPAATGSGLLETGNRVGQLRSAAAGSGSKIPTSASSSSASSTANATGRSRSSIRQKKTNNNLSLNANLQQRFKESVSINQSLSALGNCIQVMSQFSQQLDSSTATANKSRPKIPYRDSVLTKLLNRCCLSGNSKVVIIATLSPADANYDDTLSTLRFADRAKQIRTHAIVNRISRNDLNLVDSLQRENNRLKQIVDGRVTRSDDSSQTSNFDENENVMENFTGSGIRTGKKTGSGAQQQNKRGTRRDDGMAVGTPVRSKTTIRKSSSLAKLATSNSSAEKLAKQQRQLSRLVKPAEMVMSKSKSGEFTTSRQQTSEEESQTTNVEDIDDDIVEDENIQDGIISPDSDSDSFAALADEELSPEERISIFNRLLSNSTVSFRSSFQDENQKGSRRMGRPKRASRIRAGIREVAMLSSSLKKTNPYLSNLNPDEQLSGMISYIIKVGETIVGKANDADIMLHGPELRGHHAQLTRSPSTGVYIEALANEKPETQQKPALMVNGLPVFKRTKLNHCDRILFGANAFFVFADATGDGGGNQEQASGHTMANLDMVTYDMARAEVLRKVMSEAENEAMIKEIRDYTHRPGTGKKANLERQISSAAANKSRMTDPLKSGEQAKSIDSNSEELYPLPADGMDRPPQPAKPEAEVAREDALEPSVSREQVSERFSEPEAPKEEEEEEANYRDQLMEDTYEYAMPVAEVNAVAKEMDIKVTYGLKILTGEEQLPQDNYLINSGCCFLDSNASDESYSSEAPSSSAETTNQTNKKALEDSDRLTVLRKLDDLDIPPALFVKVHLDELDMDFYWSKEKFQARRDKILELYGAWDVGGKSGLVELLIEQSKAATLSSGSGRGSNSQSDQEPTNYLFDPFIDDPQTSFVLIGNAQVSLRPISHLSEIRQTFELLDVEDATVGEINIEVLPCKQLVTGSEKGSFEAYSEEELKEIFVDEPESLLGQRLVMEMKVLSCRKISQKFVNVYCQYSLRRNEPESTVKTKLLRTFSFAGIDYDSQQQQQQQQDSTNKLTSENERDEEELKFDSSHFICLEELDQELLDFLRHGFLTIQVVGQYKQANCFTSTVKSPTIVSTIINSINKYKFKIQQGANSAGSDFNNLFSSGGSVRGTSVFNFNSNDSAKSQMVAGGGGPSSSSAGAQNSNSGASSVVSTVNMFDQQNDDDDGISPINGLSQENVIDMILTKRKLDRAENQLHYLKRTINIAEHYNKKHIPVKTVKKLLNLYGRELDSGSIQEITTNEVTVKGKMDNKQSACSIQ